MIGVTMLHILAFQSHPAETKLKIISQTTHRHSEFPRSRNGFSFYSLITEDNDEIVNALVASFSSFARVTETCYK